MDRYRRHKTKQKKEFKYKNTVGVICAFLMIVVLNFSGFGTKLQKMILAEVLPFYVSEGGVSYDKAIYDEEGTPTFTDLIGSDDIEYQPETDINLVHSSIMEALTPDEISKLSDINYLKSRFYIVDKRTDLTSADVDVNKFLSEDLSIDNTTGGPKVLIFHTHISEMYADSDKAKGKIEGVYGAGERLKEALEFKYGIEVMHDDTAYDVVDGKGKINGAYERMEPNIQKILDENPTIELVIDLHRDGVADTTRLVKNINGKDYAQIMFFNGLCKVYKNGELVPAEGLSSPYVQDNLALSFNLQMAANTLYPQLTRKIYVNAYRYSLHMKPKSMLVEVGAQTNTKAEVANSMEALADIIASVVLADN